MSYSSFASQKDYEESNCIGEEPVTKIIAEVLQDIHKHWCSRIRNTEEEYEEKFGEKTVVHDQTME